MWMLTALAPADGEAILPLAKLKARVRVVAESEDTDLELMRAQAVDFVERHSGLALSRRQFKLVDKQFCSAMALPIGPVVSVDEINYFSADGTDTELSSTDWYVGAGMLTAAAGKRWPYASGLPGSVRVTFTAGLEDAEQQAPMLIAAVCVGVAALYDNRENPDWSAAARCADLYRMPGL